MSSPVASVQIVDWRHAPVSRLYYRYDEGDSFEERLGEREVEGEILARRTVSIVDGELRRVASAQGIFAREPPDRHGGSLDPEAPIDLQARRRRVAATSGGAPWSGFESGSRDGRTAFCRPSPR